MAYYANWSIYAPRPLYVKEIPPNLVDTLIYAFVDVDAQGNVSSSDPNSDFNQGNLAALYHLKQQNPQLTTLFSVGGWGKGSDPFPALAHSFEARENFATQAVEFCDLYHFDGIDVDWEFPKTPREGKEFVLLLISLFNALKRHDPPLLLTMAVPGLPDHALKIPWAQTIPLVDQVHVMTYDLHGPWGDPQNRITNHQSALLPTLLGSPKLNITAVMEFYDTFFSKDQLYVGIPLFFNTYKKATEGIPPSHYGSPYQFPSIESPNNNHTLLFNQVMADLKTHKTEGYWDPIAHAFSVYYPTQTLFGSGVNLEAIEHIAQFINNNDFAGAMVWELIGDLPNPQAIPTLREALDS